MTPDDILRASVPAAASALVVDPALSDLLFVVTTLSGGGFHVTAAETFEQAKTLLATRPPDLLVTAVRLGEYNGLHLALRGKVDRPEMAAVVTAPAFDPVLQAEADAMKATFVVLPTPHEELLAAVMRTLHLPIDAARGIRPPFERRREERRSGVSAFSGEERRVKGERRRTLRAPEQVQILS